MSFRLSDIDSSEPLPQGSSSQPGIDSRWPPLPLQADTPDAPPPTGSKQNHNYNSRSKHRRRHRPTSAKQHGPGTHLPTSHNQDDAARRNAPGRFQRIIGGALSDSHGAAQPAAHTTRKKPHISLYTVLKICADARRPTSQSCLQPSRPPPAVPGVHISRSNLPVHTPGRRHSERYSVIP